MLTCLWLRMLCVLLLQEEEEGDAELGDDEEAVARRKAARCGGWPMCSKSAALRPQFSEANWQAVADLSDATAAATAASSSLWPKCSVLLYQQLLLKNSPAA